MQVYSREIFLSNIIKIDPYNLELYRFKVKSFLDTVYIAYIHVYLHS